MKFRLAALLVSVFIVSACGGGGGGGSAPVAPAPAQVTVSLTGSASTLDQGQTFTLTWSSTNATSCTASGTWSGTKATSGSEAFSTSDSPIGDYPFGLQCSGSGGSSASSSVSLKLIEPLYNLSGKVQVAYNSFADSDVPNTDFTSISNNTASTAQVLSLPAQLIGYASKDTDEWDAYKVVVSKNQYVSLEIADYDEADTTKNDLDLIIVDLDLKIIADSESTKSYEFLSMPEGEYYIAVKAYAGASKYVLSVGTKFTQSYSASVFSSEFEYVGDKLLIQKKEILQIAQDAAWKQSQLMDQLGFDKGSDYSVYSYSEKDEFLDPRKVFKKFGFLNDSSQMSKALRTKNPEIISQAEKRKFIALLNANTPEYTILPNIAVSSHAFSSDPEYYRQWNHVAINLDTALNSIGSTVKEVVVAVLDSGRPEVGSRAYYDTNYVDDEMDFLDEIFLNNSLYTNGGNDGNGVDADATDAAWAYETFTSHGTHVASTIAAKNNGYKINGMAVKVMPIRVLPNYPYAGGLNGILEGFKYAAGLPNSSGQLPSKRADVINASLGAASSEYCSFLDPILATGIIIVASAGNDGNSINSYPASCPGVISVAAIDKDFNRAPYSQYNANVDIAAPGGFTDFGDRNGDGVSDGVYAWGNQNELKAIQGTSMASPHVAGAIALMKSVQPTLTYDDVSSILASGGMTNDLGAIGRDNSFGHGLLDVAKAISSLTNFNSETANTFGSLSQSRYDFGSSEVSIDMKLSKYGSGDLKVTGLAADNTEGLSYTYEADAEGFGDYVISLDRSVYENGTFHNAIYFKFDNNTYARGYITYNVGPEPPLGSLELAVIGIRDSSGEYIASKSQRLDLTSGTADFTFTDLKPGPYDIVIATDIDSDGLSCSRGEFCRYFPFDTSFGAFTLTADTDIGTLGLSIGSAVRAASLAQQQTDN
ncbi:S8 family serine peptidase [Gammaproteobacteria bacterium]|nr:S8 family serine peptidase [Gammaproteobacteria bacterium]